MKLLLDAPAAPPAPLPAAPCLGRAALKLVRGHLANTLVRLGAAGADAALLPVLDALDELLLAVGAWLPHAAQRGSVELLQLQVAELRADAADLAPDDALAGRRGRRLDRLYRHYALFVAEMLQLLHAAETAADAAGHAPPAAMDWPQWRAALPAMLRTLSRPELAGWLELLRAQAGPALHARVQAELLRLQAVGPAA